MSNLSRRRFIATGIAAASLRGAMPMATRQAGRRILTLVYDKSLGMMRAIDRWVP